MLEKELVDPLKAYLEEALPKVYVNMLLDRLENVM